MAAWATGGKASAKAAKANGKPDTASIVTAFGKLGVKQSDLEFMLADGTDSKPMAEWNDEDVMSLRAIYKDKQAEAKGTI